MADGRLYIRSIFFSRQPLLYSLYSKNCIRNSFRGWWLEKRGLDENENCHCDDDSVNRTIKIINTALGDGTLFAPVLSRSGYIYTVQFSRIGERRLVSTTRRIRFRNEIVLESDIFPYNMRSRVMAKTLILSTT